MLLTSKRTPVTIAHRPNKSNLSIIRACAVVAFYWTLPALMLKFLWYVNPRAICAAKN